jgi:glycosyltransferase involved in cell wall biosynthesis
MAYHANSDAILWFTGRIWPAIHERFPHWTLTLVGSDPPPRVRELSTRPGVEVTGTVPDVRPYYAEAVLAIVPLLTGGGTRLKILEALAAGVPVVSTTMGVEGLTVTPGKEVLIADTEADWLPACSSLADQGDLWRKLVTAGRRLAETRYDWDVLGKSLVTTYRHWLSEAETHP